MPAAVVGIVFVSAFVRSAIGFGDAVVAMPLLVLVTGLKTASPLVAFMGPTISLLILAGSWRRIELKSAGRLVFASLVGIPLGIYGLARLPEGPLKVGLGLLILLYGLFGLARPKARIRNERPWLVWTVGVTAGVLGGAYNTNGPPVVAYGMLKGWPAEDFRARLSGYFLPTALMVLAGHGLAGMWTSEVLTSYLWSLPAIVTGVVLGGLLNKRIPQALFGRLVNGCLAAMGALLLFREIL
ncbi:MAG: sulfite exporter TauE/SafE family protein [Candidatus Aminicenantes bacterium]|nr:sulfite exporter TauE/SafE family protein [Candidatus Aminicenantes bacterium]NLH75833.1 sulfite exporter TauE/SafE family protein [Acidobacteriota bacterium]